LYGGLVGAEVFHQAAEVVVVAVEELCREDVVVAGVGSKRKDSQTCWIAYVNYSGCPYFALILSKFLSLPYQGIIWSIVYLL
jgi:hypothetical protein